MSHTDVMLDWGIHQVLREAEDREAKKAEKRYNKRTYGGHF